MKTIDVNKENDGKKLNTVLLNEFPSLSVNSVYKALRKKDIRVNGVKVTSDCTVFLGDKITIYITDNYLFGDEKFDIPIIFEDNNSL